MNQIERTHFVRRDRQEGRLRVVAVKFYVLQGASRDRRCCRLALSFEICLENVTGLGKEEDPDSRPFADKGIVADEGHVAYHGRPEDPRQRRVTDLELMLKSLRNLIIHSSSRQHVPQVGPPFVRSIAKPEEVLEGPKTRVEALQRNCH